MTQMLLLLMMSVTEMSLNQEFNTNSIRKKALSDFVMSLCRRKGVCQQKETKNGLNVQIQTFFFIPNAICQFNS